MSDDEFEEKSVHIDKTGWSSNGTRQVYENGEWAGEEYSPLEAEKAAKRDSPSSRRRRPAAGDSHSLVLIIFGFVFRNIPFVLIAFLVAERLLPEQFVWYARWIIGGAAGFLVSIGLIWIYTYASLVEGPMRTLLLPVRLLTVVIVCGGQAAIAFLVCYRFIGSGPLSFPPELSDITLRLIVGTLVGLPAAYFAGRWAWKLWYGEPAD